jgi:hypothetical protein
MPNSLYVSMNPFWGDFCEGDISPKSQEQAGWNVPTIPLVSHSSSSIRGHIYPLIEEEE